MSEAIPAQAVRGDQDHVPPRSGGGRRRQAGTLLVAGGVALAAAEVVHPRGGDDVFALNLAESRTGWTAWGLLIMATALLQLPGVVALRAAVQGRRGARLAGAGGAILVVALVALFAFGQSHAEGASLVGEAPVSPDLLAAFARADAAPSLGVTAVLALIGFHVGWPMLLAGLARGRSVPRPLAAAGAAALFASFFGAVLGQVGETVLFVVAAASISAIGVGLVRAAGEDA